jgi:hypothetical protein
VLVLWTYWLLVAVEVVETLPLAVVVLVTH